MAGIGFELRKMIDQREGFIAALRNVEGGGRTSATHRSTHKHRR